MDASTDVHAFIQYEAELRSMLAEGEFDKLNCIADRSLSTKERFKGGNWKLHILYVGMSSPVEPRKHATDQDWKTLVENLKAWLAAHPQSRTAHIALASAYLEYAWQARGSGYSNTVTESGWDLFGQRTAEGKRLLLQIPDSDRTDPEWYFAMQTVGQNESWDQSEMRALFEKAYRFEPGYYYYDSTLANYLLPKWGGEKGQTEKFMDEMVERVGGDEGAARYYLTARMMLCGCGAEEPDVAWPKIAAGYEAVERKYGTSMDNLNRIAHLATQHMDPLVADKAMTRIGDQWDPKDWKDKEEFDGWKKWAAGYAPVYAKRLENEAAAQANAATPDGARYKSSFEKTYKDLVRACAKTEANNSEQPEKFETLTCIGAQGTIEDIKIYWNSAMAVCVYQKLRTFQLDKSTAFPPPPTAPYWVRLDLDGAEFGSGSGQQ